MPAAKVNVAVALDFLDSIVLMVGILSEKRQFTRILWILKGTFHMRFRFLNFLEDRFVNVVSFLPRALAVHVSAWVASF